MRYIVTTGHTYADIDGLACVFAYHELLGKLGIDSLALIKGEWNHSVPREVSGWNLHYEKEYLPMPDDMVVMMDVSDVGYLQTGLDISKVHELYDHHFGFEKHWQNLLGDKCHIEYVGACATLIIEEWRKRLPHSAMSYESAQLLGWALISNTLNLQSVLVTQRDIAALAIVEPILRDNPDWIAQYFESRDESVNDDPLFAIRWDTKHVRMPNMAEEFDITQLEMWDGYDFIRSHIPMIHERRDTETEVPWLLSVLSIKENKNYLYTKDRRIQMLLFEKIGTIFEGDLGQTPRLILRKEILRELRA